MKEIIMAISKQNSWSLTILLIGGVFLNACLSQVGETISSLEEPNTYTQLLSPLDTSTALALKELTLLPLESNSGPVAAVNYVPSKNIVMAAYTGDGYLRSWDVNNVKVILEHRLGITGTKGVGFDQTGNLIIGAMRSEIRDDYGPLTEYIGGIAVWDAITGEMITCLDTTCYSLTKTPPGKQKKLLNIGAAINSQGRWVIVYGTNVWSIVDLTNQESSQTRIISDPDFWRYTALIVFDPNNDRIAIAFKEGEIEIEQVSGHFFFSPVIRVGENKERGLHDVSAMSFSPDGDMLARIQNDILSVWKLKKRSGDLFFEHIINGGRIIAFDQLSNLIIVGSDDKISIWDIKEKSSIVEYETPGLTSMTISSDNRLMIWGDKSSTIHVWGIP